MTDAKWWGTAVLMVVAACGPRSREPDDTPTAGSRPTGSVLPGGGAMHSTPGGAGGAPHGDSPPEGGAAVEPPPSDGGAGVDPGPSLGGAAPTECFSPTQNLQLAPDPTAVGCPCGPGARPQCVGTRYLAPSWELSFECVDGAWAVVPEGACDGGAGCQTEDGIWASGAVGVPDPFSCNTCECRDGQITGCTEIFCPKECPVNSTPALGCLDCVGEECRLAHYACFTSQYLTCNDRGCFAMPTCADPLR